MLFNSVLVSTFYVPGTMGQGKLDTEAHVVAETT